MLMILNLAHPSVTTATMLGGRNHNPNSRFGVPDFEHLGARCQQLPISCLSRMLRHYVISSRVLTFELWTGRHLHQVSS
jgi:hypothetical protein